MGTRSIVTRLTVFVALTLLICGACIGWLGAQIQAGLLGNTGASWKIPLVVLAFGAVGTLVFRFAVRHWLHRPAETLIARLAAMSIGECDVTKRIDMQRPDELGVMATHFDAFVARVQEVLKTACSLSDDADSSASVIASESQRLASSSSMNAATIEEIMASLGEINDLSAATATSCQEAARGAGRAHEAVARGNSEVDRLTEAMDQIIESSQTITKVVAVIRDVSFQTNLLALKPPSKPRVLVRVARALPWSPRRFAVSRCAVPRPRQRRLP
jgi:methyl-accepting chemotaxis protein